MIFLFSQNETTGTASHANCKVRLLRHYCLLLGHNTNYFHPYFAIIVPPLVFTMSFRACLHGVGDPGLVGLVSFVFTLWGTQTKEPYPTRPGSPTPCKQGLIPSFNVLSGCLFSLNFIVVATL